MLKPEYTKARRPKKVKLSTAVAFDTAKLIEAHRVKLPRKPKPTAGRVIDALAKHAVKTEFSL